ncbi:MAG TPA: tannase/feruloyl esterase family alpha/beta hydrolase [Bryobacteraceae bacterium]|nr:tannase/feruloyl esterase family alpha/beta hydrolase [Bryobacteraceae bacterium]
MRRCLRILLAVVAVVPCFGADRSCEGLGSLPLAQGRITFAQPVAAGGFTPPTGSQPIRDLPAFCRVAATLAPSRDSDIRIEVWLPATGWNGKFQAVGNGGWSGAINYGGMANALRRGYASASTDTGHSGGSAQFAFGHPEKLIDFGYRSEHEMTVKAKTILTAFYGGGPRFSYWNGCSSGGKQGLKEAQKYPEDYDGIIAGAPANNWVALLSADMMSSVAMLKDPASRIPSAKLARLHKAAVEACDAVDGVKDGLIDDPTKCHFDPAVLVCKGPEEESCLTSAQVAAAKAVYGPFANPRTRREIFPGLEPGSEPGWGAFTGPAPFPISNDYFRYVVHKDPEWDFRSFDIEKDVALAERLDHDSVLKAVDPNLQKFVSRGGKLILYHGWSDNLIAPRNSVNYYNSVVSRLGGAEKTEASIRLFMAPGMGHCSGGDGPNIFDMVTPLEQWVEQGKAPERIVASHKTGDQVDRTRPWCPYPQVAQYKGTGSIDDAANFVCTKP